MKKRAIRLFISIFLLLGILLSLPLFAGAEIVSENAELPFRDVSKSAWYREGATFCYVNGIIQGQSNSYTFAPNANVTRATFVVMLARAVKADTSQYTESQFSDCKASWYIPSVEWAAQMGYVNGTGKGCFSPNKAMTREELASLLSRFMKEQGYEIEATEGLIEDYEDRSKISSWAVEGMEYVIATGIITSTSQSALKASPKSTLTRAQASVIFMRLLENYINGSCEHQLVAAACLEGEHCKLCGMVTSLPMGHRYDAESCLEPMVCKNCGEEAEPHESLHSYTAASCTEPAVCRACQKQGEAARGHKFTPATCLNPKTCTECGITEGEASGHSTDNGVCQNCGTEIFASAYDRIGYHMSKNGIYSDKSCYIIGRWESYSDHIGYTQISYYDTVDAYVFAYESISYSGKETLTLQITVPSVGDSYNYIVNYYENGNATASASGKIESTSYTAQTALSFEKFSGNNSLKSKIENYAKSSLDECLVQSDLLLDGLCGAGLSNFNFVNIKWNNK